MRKIFNRIIFKIQQILGIRFSRFYIFDKTHVDYSVYNKALKAAVRSDDPNLRAIAINLQCDHRVTEDRELEFRQTFEGAGRNLKRAIEEYHEQSVAKATDPKFCHPCLADFSNGAISCPSGFNPDLQLASVLTFHKLRERIMDIDALSIKSDLWDAELVAAKKDSGLFSKWLDKHLLDAKGNPKSPKSKEVRKFIADIFKLANYDLHDASGAYNESKRTKPFWVTDWDMFNGYAAQPVDRWNQVVGVLRRYPTWQIVITYPAKDVDFLYRPTQLDGGYYPQHFPPPREIASWMGGYTMDWGPGDKILLPEFIHKQIKLKFEYWENAGSLLAKTNDITCDLKASRLQHYEKLKDSYDPGKLAAWLRHPF